MSRDIETIGACPKCGSKLLNCRFNHFERDDLKIDSWEHRCPDCGFRETTAFRSDEPTSAPNGDPTRCPYCGRVGRRRL